MNERAKPREGEEELKGDAVIKANSMSRNERRGREERRVWEKKERKERSMEGLARGGEWMPYPRCHGSDLVCDSC